MYKNKDKQREASKERMRRYRARQKGVTEQGVTTEGVTETEPKCDKVSVTELSVPLSIMGGQA